VNLSPILVSMKTASVAIVVTFFLGILAARAVAGIRRRGLKMILDGVLTLPLVLPPTVAGFFLLFLFGVRGPVGKFFLDFFSVRIAFSWAATVIAAVAISFPLMYRSCRGALEQVDPNLVYAARTLGLSEWTIFRRISLPTALPGVASGAVLAFARGLGEFGATAMLAGNIAGKTRTLPLAVYSSVAAGEMDESYGYVLIIVIISFAVVALMNYFTIQEDKRAGGKK
jgi:molybdate transport system permease protein